MEKNIEKSSDKNREALTKEILSRRTFAIISHPDAGKTTLTEKLLLFGGAIREAGSVKSRKSNKYAVSDWMEIEKQRGISVTSSVLQFDYDGHRVNILDTPGHQDFSEDTYRTLMAADAAVMVIDSAKGVEAQTKKLFKVTQLRNIPILTFSNKLDRQSKSPFELMDDLEESLGIRSYPMNWPIGSGQNFKGIYNRFSDTYEFVDGSYVKGLRSPEALSFIGESGLQELIEELEILDTAGDEYDAEKIKNGKLTPMFFGSALTNFGVQTFLTKFLEIAPSPLPRHSNIGDVTPFSQGFSGFIFKIQANMNPQHRDRIAFLRIVSGNFERGMLVNHVDSNKKIRLNQPQQFLAQDRVIVEKACAGDIIGLHDPGLFKIGDTLTSEDANLKFDSIPSFAPEYFAKVYTKNSLKRKQFLKGATQLSEEGSIQVFKRPNIGVEELIVGVVGALQFEILDYRLKNEYGVDIEIDQLPYQHIRWAKAKEGKLEPNKINLTMDTLVVVDEYDNVVLLFQNEWSVRQLEERNKGIELSEISFRN